MNPPPNNPPNTNDALAPGGYSAPPPPLPGYQPSPQQPGAAPPMQHPQAAFYYHQHPGQPPQPGYAQGYAPAVSYQNYANYPSQPSPAGAGGGAPTRPQGQVQVQGAPPQQQMVQGQPWGAYQPYGDAAVYQYPPGFVPNKQQQQQQPVPMATLYEPTPVRAQPPQQPPVPPQPSAAKPAPKEPAIEPKAAEQATETEKDGEKAEPSPAREAVSPAKETLAGDKDKASKENEQAKEQDDAAEDDAATEAAKAAPEDTSMDYPMKKAAEPPAKQSTNNDGHEIFPFGPALSHLHLYQRATGGATFVPVSHPAYSKIMTSLVDAGVEGAASALWEQNLQRLKAYKEKNKDCDVPFTDDPLGKWVERQRKLYADHPQSTSSSEPDKADESTARLTSRFAKLTALGFDFTTPTWDTRLRELMAYQKEHGHCSPSLAEPKIGIWCVNQRFNLRDMPKERVAALDAIGFVWNHNRKRNQAAWDKKYGELLDYKKEHGHCNVPATHRHSKLGNWVGKQREEYKRMKDKKSSQLDMYRIEKLNAVGFKWSLQNYTVVSWEDRFEALKQFKEQHGHCRIPRNHQQFGSWPTYQRSQYRLFKEGKKSKMTQERADKLIEIGFFEIQKGNRYC
ncbi:hypothetical protein ACHAXT_008380 [Thalassiosira profunda]